MSAYHTQVAVRDIKKGDRFGAPGGWIAIGDAELDDVQGAIVLDVQYEPDGGRGQRIWDVPDLELNIVRRA